LIVVDASALADALIDDGSVGDRARSALSEDLHWAAPGHLVVEVISVIRSRLLGGKLQAQRADEAIAVLIELEMNQIDVLTLAHRVWELRDNLTAYDAAYLALAEELGCALLTSDARLARADGPRCPVQLIK
jgi:predicted nucleic acid-binding protein